MSRFIIRRAKAEDGAALCAIYAPYITDTTITFEYEVRRTRRFPTASARPPRSFPISCAKRTAESSATPTRTASVSARRTTGMPELSVYLKQGTHGRGIGTVLLACLIELLEMQGLRHLYSCVTMPNPRSVGMQHRLGFEDAGVWHSSGWKFGAWHDVAWFEKHVGGGEPKPVVPFPELDGDIIQKTLNIYTEKLNLEDK